MTLPCSGTSVVEQTPNQCQDSRIPRHLPRKTQDSRLISANDFTLTLHSMTPMLPLMHQSKGTFFKWTAPTKIRTTLFYLSNHILYAQVEEKKQIADEQQLQVVISGVFLFFFLLLVYFGGWETAFWCHCHLQMSVECGSEFCLCTSLSILCLYSILSRSSVFSQNINIALYLVYPAFCIF